jgi:hypothetical protein
MVTSHGNVRWKNWVNSGKPSRVSDGNPEPSQPKVLVGWKVQRLRCEEPIR